LSFQDGLDNITQGTALVNYQKKNLLMASVRLFDNANGGAPEYSWSKSSNWRFIFLTNLNKINAD
jgi:hypothetical protein